MQVNLDNRVAERMSSCKAWGTLMLYNGVRVDYAYEGAVDLGPLDGDTAEELTRVAMNVFHDPPEVLQVYGNKVFGVAIGGNLIRFVPNGVAVLNERLLTQQYVQ